MTIIEAVSEVESFKTPIDIMSGSCPSDYDFKNMRGCKFWSKGSMPSELECIRCWTRKCKEET